MLSHSDRTISMCYNSADECLLTYLLDSTRLVHPVELRFQPPEPDVKQTQHRLPIRPEKLVLHPAEFMASLHLAERMLKKRGLQLKLDTGGNSTAAADTPPRPIATVINMLQGAQAVIELGYEKVNKLIRIFMSEVYPLYPCIDLDSIQEKVNSLFHLLSNFGGRTVAEVDVDIIDIDIIKATVAVAQCVGGEMQSSLACGLESKLLWSLQSTLDQERSRIEDVAMATLVVSLLILYGKKQTDTY